MNDSNSATLRGAAFASALALTLASSPAVADDDSIRAFSATTEVDSASGTVVTRDVLVLRTDDDGTSLSVMNGGSSTPPVAVALASDGELLANTNEPSITCYNMAEMLENAARHPSARPAAVLVAIAGRAVPVPMPVRLERGTAGRESIFGTGTASFDVSTGDTPTSAAVAVTARIDTAGTRIESASFDERTSIVRGTAARPVGRTACSIVRMTVPIAS